MRQRRALGTLFGLLTLGFAGIAYTAAQAGGSAWVIAVAAAALGVWMATLAWGALRPR